MARVAKEASASGKSKVPARSASQKTAEVAETNVVLKTAPTPVATTAAVLHQEPDLNFDREWYEKQYPDVVQAGLDPATHYRQFGWSENRWPNPRFSPFAYRAANSDLATYDGDLFLHYIFYGAAEGRPLS